MDVTLFDILRSTTCENLFHVYKLPAQHSAVAAYGQQFVLSRQNFIVLCHASTTSDFQDAAAHIFAVD